MSLKKDKGKILFFRESVFKVAELIFNYPNRVFHIRMLEKELKLSTTAIINAVEEMKKYKIVRKDETALTTNIKADLESEAYRFYKLIFNLYRLKRYMFVDGLIRIFNNPEAIVLFGSFANGEDIEKSDIDILVITGNTNKNLETFTEKWEKELKRKIDIVVLKSLKNSSAEFKNAIANGIVLHGYVKIA